MNKFDLIEESSILNIYKRIDRNTPKNIESLQNISIPTKYEFNIKDFKKGDREFSGDFNSRAEYIQFYDNVKYVKFYIPLNIFCENDLIHISNPLQGKSVLTKLDVNNYLETIYMRGNDNKTTLTVYLNGEKLPDKSVLLTVYQGKIDVYFQEDLLDEINEICFSVRDVSTKYPYLNYTWYGETSLVRSEYYFNVNNIYTIYKNGQFLIPNEDFIIQNGKIDITIDNIEEDDLFELVLESGDTFCLGKSDKTFSNIFDVKELYRYDNKGNKVLLDTIKQPISKNNVYIFIDGYKICNDDIAELNGSFYLLKDYDKMELNYYILVKMNYTNTEEETKVDYKDSYSKINHLYDRVLIHRQLANKNTLSSFLFPSTFTASQMLVDYPPVYIENLVEKPYLLTTNRRVFAEKAIEAYIKSNSYNTVHFLKEFNQPEKEVFNLTLTEKNKVNYIVRSTVGLPPYYTHEFKEDRLLIIYNYEHKNYVEKIYVDDYLLPRNQYEIINIENTGFSYFFIKVDNNGIKTGSNIRMTIEDGNNKRPLKNQFFINKESDRYKLDLESIELSDLRYDLLKFFTNDTNKDNYISLLEGIDYDIELSDNEFYFILKNEDLLNKTIFYMNPFFIYRKDILTGKNLIDELSFSITINELNDNWTNNYDRLSLVDVKCNNLEIYYNGYRLINGVDFVVLESTLYNSVKENKILFNIKIESGKVVSFIFKNRRETTVITKNEIDSQYGLFYLNKYDYPLDTEYNDFYLDNKKIEKENIISYTNNLIQIKNKTYFKYFAIISNIDLPHSIISYLKDLEAFNRVPYEKFFKELFNKINNLDNTFELVKDLNLTDKDKVNIIDKEPNVPKYDLRLDTLYDYFEQGLIDKKIDCKKGILEEDVRNNEIFDYFPTDVVPLDASSELVFRYATMSSLKNCYSNIMISELFGNERSNSIENEDGEIDDLENHPIYQYIYDENDIILDASKETPSMHVFDATEEIDVDVIVFGCSME